ncbi:ABC transporter permease [Bacillus sp. NPDC077411]|uniref:ABC transporter permease n=1 Tax=Bacillus sp. NPDC077411 TaxID=3363947 RepID=UPI0037C8BA34
MKGYFLLSIKFLKSQKNRTIFSIVGVTIGIALLIFSNILIYTVERSNEKTIKEKYGDYDLIIGYKDSTQFLSQEDINTINNSKEVKNSTPLLYPYIGEQHPYKEMAAQPMYVGIKDDELAKQHIFAKLSSGKLPGPNEIVIPYNTAHSKNLKIGSKLELPFPPNSIKEVTVSGIMEQNQYLNSVVLFNYKWLADMTNQNGHTTTLIIKLNDLGDKEQFIQFLKSKYKNLSIDSQIKADKERENIGGLKPIIQWLSIAILLGSMLLIIGALQMSIQERKKELATLRLLGIKRRKIFLLVMNESFIIAIISALTGLITGIFLSILSYKLIENLMNLQLGFISIPWNSILIGILSTIILTMISSIFPALSASNLTPIEAYHSSTDLNYKQNPLTVAASILMFLVSCTIYLLNYYYWQQSNIYIIGIVLFLLSIHLGLPTMFKIITNLITILLKRFFKGDGLLASRNVLKQIKRNIQVVRVLILGIVICIVGLHFLEVVKDTTQTDIKHRYPLNYTLHSNSSYEEPGLSEDLYQNIKSIKNINAIPVYKSKLFFTLNLNQNINSENTVTYNINGQKQFLVGVQGLDFSSLQKTLPIKIKQGTINEESLNEGGVILTSFTSEILGYKLHDTIRLIPEDQLATKDEKINFENGNSEKNIISLKVVGIINQNPLTNDQSDLRIYTSPTLMKNVAGVNTIDKIYFNITHNKNTVSAQIKSLIQNQPSSKVILYSQEEEINKFLQQYYQRIVILLYTVCMIIFLAFIALMNGMASSLRERAREFATMRAIGSKRNQIIRLSLLEGSIVSISGGIIGVFCGIILVYQLLVLLKTTTFIFPLKIVLICLSISPILGIVASLIPAAKLSKVHILDKLNNK